MANVFKICVFVKTFALAIRVMNLKKDSLVFSIASSIRMWFYSIRGSIRIYSDYTVSSH